MEKRPFQFSVLAVFAVMTAVALVMSGWLPWLWLATAVVFHMMVYCFLAICVFKVIADAIQRPRPPESRL